MAAGALSGRGALLWLLSDNLLGPIAGNIPLGHSLYIIFIISPTYELVRVDVRPPSRTQSSWAHCPRPVYCATLANIDLTTRRNMLKA